MLIYAVFNIYLLLHIYIFNFYFEAKNYESRYGYCPFDTLNWTKTEVATSGENYIAYAMSMKDILSRYGSNCSLYTLILKFKFTVKVMFVQRFLLLNIAGSDSRVWRHLGNYNQSMTYARFYHRGVNRGLLKPCFNSIRGLHHRLVLSTAE